MMYIHAVFFSPAGSTRSVVSAVARVVAEQLQYSVVYDDITLPLSRESVRSYTSSDIVIYGMPTYAGRIPNKILPIVKTHFVGNGARAVPIVTFGNRSYDSSLTELCDVLSSSGFVAVAAAAFATRHVFSRHIGTGRPDSSDNDTIAQFADMLAKKLQDVTWGKESVVVKDGAPVANYYTPLGADGKPVQFLKAKPKTKSALCTDCKVCVKNCPMGAIDYADVNLIPGTCIKCQACVHKCPTHAKYFDDVAFLSHVAMLEQHYTARAACEYFFS